MRRPVFLGSILSTIVAFLAACFCVVTTLVWVVRQWAPDPWFVWAVGLGLIGTAMVFIWQWWRLPAEIGLAAIHPASWLIVADTPISP